VLKVAGSVNHGLKCRAAS